MNILLVLLVALNLILVLILVLRPKSADGTEKLKEELGKIEPAVREELKTGREETNTRLKENREELAAGMNKQREELTALLNKQREELALLRTELAKTQNDFRKEISDNQKELATNLDRRQENLLQSTEKRLEAMRETVDEKLQKTLNERISQSFKLVSDQLQSVQNGLGEMKNLATDVSGLKKVLSNVKVRGTFGEVQLEALLEQMLSPEQYEANVHTKRGSGDVVEFAVKLPGKDQNDESVYLPIDAKFPKDAYEQYFDAFESGEPAQIAATSKQLETVIKKMAKDIHDKYLDPPFTTDFAILFLPFESIYAEVIRRTELMENLQRQFKVIVTGPTTLGAILNSLQMGFKTLAIQKRSSEVWQVLGAVKTEFSKFGEMLDKVQNNIRKAGEDLDIIRGTRTKAIERKLRDIQSLPADQSASILPVVGLDVDDNDENPDTV
jgi:DNA recombination protein RmuC